LWSLEGKNIIMVKIIRRQMLVLLKNIATAVEMGLIAL
jgi:hypothetical protein